MQPTGGVCDVVVVNSPPTALVAAASSAGAATILSSPIAVTSDDAADGPRGFGLPGRLPRSRGKVAPTPGGTCGSCRAAVAAAVVIAVFGEPVASPSPGEVAAESPPLRKRERVKPRPPLPTPQRTLRRWLAVTEVVEEDEAPPPPETGVEGAAIPKVSARIPVTL